MSDGMMRGGFGKTFGELKTEWSVIDARYKKAQAFRSPLPRKIVCRICGLGPLDGVALRKIGWTWNCMQHPIKHRL